jgi:hypothetical protein
MDVNGMSVKELKELITKAKMSYAECIDKTDLRARASEAANALAKAETAQCCQAAENDKAPTTTTRSAEEEPAQDASPAVDPSISELVTPLSLKDLKALIIESGLSHDDCTDKAELRERGCEAMARLMVPGAHCGPISKRLVEAKAQHEAAAEAEAKEAKRTLERHKREAKAAAEKAAAEAEAEAKKAREREKRKEKKGRKKANRAKAREEGTREEGVVADGGSEDEDEVGGEEDELMRLAAVRLQRAADDEASDGTGSDTGDAANALQPESAVPEPAAFKVAGAEGEDGDGKPPQAGTLPAGWRVEGGILLEEGESAPARKSKPRKKR